MIQRTFQPWSRTAEEVRTKVRTMVISSALVRDEIVGFSASGLEMPGVLLLSVMYFT